MSDRHIVAMGGGGFSYDDPVLDRYVLDLVASPRPRVCFVPTAASSMATYVTRFLAAFPSSSFEPSFLDLFDRTVTDLPAFLQEQDVIYVAGGNTANMLAIWRIHGADRALRGAWEAGVVLCGLSAGANCWFEASTTDSFLLGRADPLEDGLGLLPGSFCPHYDGEEQRRRSFHALVGSGALPAGIACDDYAAAHFLGTDLLEAVASKPGAGAYRVARGSGGGADEEPIPVRALSSPLL